MNKVLIGVQVANNLSISNRNNWKVFLDDVSVVTIV